MSPALVAAAVIATLTSAVHSVLGEWLIFRHLRSGTLVPGGSAAPLRSGHVRILWATWHLASVLGWACAAMLFALARMPQGAFENLVLAAIASAYAASAILVLVGTRGRHPGWIALGAVALLTWSATGIRW